MVAIGCDTWMVFGRIHLDFAVCRVTVETEVDLDAGAVKTVSVNFHVNTFYYLVCLTTNVQYPYIPHVLEKYLFTSRTKYMPSGVRMLPI